MTGKSRVGKNSRKKQCLVGRIGFPNFDKRVWWKRSEYLGWETNMKIVSEYICTRSFGN